MGFFDTIGDIVSAPIDAVSGVLGGGGTDVSTHTVTKSKQKINVSVDPQIRVFNQLDTAPLAKAYKLSSEHLASGIERYGQAVAVGQLALTSAAEREAQTKAEQTLIEQQQFAWIKQAGEKAGKYILFLALAGLTVWYFTSK